MTSLVSASQVVTGQVQSLDSVRAHALPSDAMIFASGTKVQPANQNPGSYAIVESGVNSLGVTATGSVPAVTQSPFADLYKEGSIYLNGTVGNYLQNTATYSNSTIQWNTTGMTIEAWVNYQTFAGASYASTTPQPTLFGLMSYTPTGDYWSFGANTAGYVNFYYAAGSAQTVMSTTQLSANTWNHIAMTCSTSGQIFIFVNGVQTTVVANRNGTLVTPATNFETVQGTPSVASYTLTVGQWASTATNAYVADLRLTTGTPVYTGLTGSLATFTVPSAPLSLAASGTTQFLLRAGQNSPTVQNGALTFDRGLRQYMEMGPMTWNWATRGFTAVFKYTWNGVAAPFDRILSLTTTNSVATMAGLTIDRANLTNALAIWYYVGSATTVNLLNTTTIINPGTTYVITFVYNPSIASGTGTFWVNGVPNATATGLSSTITADLLCPYARIGANQGGFEATSASINVLAVYNRALSNVEILNAYSALTTNTVNAPIEIGDANGTPALSIAGDGRVNITKMGQTSNVVQWPPAAMTGYVTSINGGTYVASASSETTLYNSWYAFDKTTATYWASNATSGPYSTTTNLYTGPVTTTDVNGTIYPGEWIQFQAPVPIALTSYTITFFSQNYGASNWIVLGSRDGVNWTPVNTQSGQVVTGPTVPLSYTVAATLPFSYYRFAFTRSYGGSANNINIYEIALNGTADTAQPLTVAQPVTLSYGAQTASLTGISGDKYVPQDFSSSGLNIPAYVVSNTATVANTVAFSSFGPFAGEGSVYFPGGNGAFVNFGFNTPLSFSWWTNIWTLETWFHATSFGGAGVTPLFGQVNSGANYYSLNVNNGTVYWYYFNGSGVNVGTGTITTNSWNHLAVSFDGTTIRVFVNGVASGSAAVSGTPQNSPGSVPMTIGGSAGSQQIWGYISNLRFTRGAALYTTTFTPPTGPLQPIQGTTQAGLPYGTVLLLRNAPAPGRVLTSKFGGANSGGVNGAPLTLAFPPAAMTGYSTALNAGYGQGTYVASASTEFSPAGSGYPYAWYAFDQNSSTYWVSVGSGYNTSIPYNYTGSLTTVDVNGNTYSGEWIQIQSPSSIVLTGYTTVFNSWTSAAPSTFWILGSRDGTNWFLVDSRTGLTYTTASQSFTVTSGQAFTYFRYVTRNVTGTGGYVQIHSWTLNGTIEGPGVSADGRLGLGVTNPTQALEVAGSAVVAGTLSAGNPLMFRNRIINGDMRVFQRGTTFSLSGGSVAYTLDRWLQYTVSGTTRTVSNVVDVPFRSGFISSANVVATASTTTAEFWLSQTVEMYNVLDLIGSPVTLSFWYKSNRVGNHGVRFNSGGNIPGNPDTFQTFTVFNANTWEYKVLTFNTLIQCTVPGPSTWNGFGIAVNIGPVVYNMGSTSIANGDYFTLTGVQLEKGSVATPFEVRPYATELALCQRYYYQITALTNAGGVQSAINWGIAYVRSSGNASIYYSLPVPMRAQPTFSATAALSVDWNGISNLGTFTSPTLNTTKSSNKDIEIDGGCTGGTQGQAGAIIFPSATAGQYASFNAEL